MGEAVRRGAAWLAGRGCPAARLDAEILVAHALGIDRLAIYTDHERPLATAERAACRELLARRGRREPVAYVTGRRAFRRIALAVGPAVLVPRPETELLVEWVVEAAPPAGEILDWGTGSGAVALAVADERPDLRVTGVDRSPAALEVARANLAAHPALAPRVALAASDGFGAVAGRRFAVVAANPPYLSDAELAAGPPELAHEPAEALAAGPTGLEALEAIAAAAPDHLVPGGWLLAEVGAGQAPAVERLWGDAGLRSVATRADLAGVGRVVGGRMR